MLLLLLGCNPCEPGATTLELGHWNDVMLPQGVTACTHHRARKDELWVVGSEDLAQQMTDALGRAGWSPLEAGVLVRDGKKTTITTSDKGVTLALSDHFDRARKFPDWEARMAAAAEVEKRLLEGPPESAPQRCPDALEVAGLVDLRDLRGDESPGFGFATSSAWKPHLGLGPLVSDDVDAHQARYEYATALVERPVGVATVLDTIAPDEADGDTFQAGHVLGMVWIVDGDQVLCGAPFTATNAAVIEVSGRGDDDDAVRANLVGRTTDAIYATYNGLRGR